METKTNIRDHWMIDKEYSNCEASVSEYKIILDSINSFSKSLHFDKVSNYSNFQSSFNDLSKQNEEAVDFFRTRREQEYGKRKNSDYITNSQNWIGYITEIFENEFSAKLIDKKDPTTYEIAIFNFMDVSEGDMNLLKEGASFYWSVGYATSKGQIMKQSLLRFKRSVIPVDEFDAIMDNAEDLNLNLLWD